MRRLYYGGQFGQFDVVPDVNFNKQGKHHNVYLGSDTELEKQKLICEFQSKVIENKKPQLASQLAGLFVVFNLKLLSFVCQ